MQDTLNRRGSSMRTAATASPPRRDAKSRRGAGTSRRRKDPLWARLVVIVGALLLTLSGTAIIGGNYLLMRYSNQVDQTQLLAPEKHISISGPINLLLVGVDERPTPPGGVPEPVRADSIIIVHISATHDQAYMVSIPRDSYVDIPAYPRTRSLAQRDKINSAFAFGSQNGGGKAGGFDLLAKTVTQLTGIRFNAGAIVNFDGFRTMVDALGGIDLYVDQRVTSIHVGQDRAGNFKAPFHINDDGTVGYAIQGATPQVYEIGLHKNMPAWQALDYCRQRDLLRNADGTEGQGDYDRQRHQQQFLKAVIKKTVSTGVISNPAKLDAVLKAAAKAVTFDGRGVPIKDWIFMLKGIDPGNVIMIKTNAGKFNSATVDGRSVENVSPASLDLFHYIRDDKVADFLMQHGDWVSRDS
jgi:LCP family protein required for cell wall assembly